MLGRAGGIINTPLLSGSLLSPAFLLPHSDLQSDCCCLGYLPEPGASDPTWDWDPRTKAAWRGPFCLCHTLGRCAQAGPPITTRSF